MRKSTKKILKKTVKKIAPKKPDPTKDELRSLRAANKGLQALTDAIHAILNEHGGDEAVTRIRTVLYGDAPSDAPAPETPGEQP